MDSNIGKKLDGRYELLELIGVGGMADIYRARDIVEDRIVAVKILKTEFAGSDEFLRRFRNESKAIALLSHPNIVKIYDVGLTDKVQFTATQLIVWAILVIIVQVLDYLTPLIGTKYSGGSKWGNRGCIAGTVIGIFLFPPWGIIFGPLVGAVIGELLGGKLTHEALKAGLGAFVGFLLGVILKVSLCGYFVVVFISALF